MNAKFRIIVRVCAALACLPAATLAQNPRVLTGQNAFTDYSKEQPGIRRHLTLADLPGPYTTGSTDNGAHIVPRPDGAWPKAPDGFRVQLYTERLRDPRKLKAAPNGDIFVAEGASGVVQILRGVTADGKVQQIADFATGLRQPYGIAFYPLGNNPRWVYVANTDSVVRFAYTNGDLKARAAPEVIVPDLPGGGRLRGGGHWTRDLAFSLDGKTMYVSVGSHSNADDPDFTSAEKDRADVLSFNPEGKGRAIYVSGVRNAVGIATNPLTGELWGSVNERDGLGDNLVPDYITHFTPGGFYGWPWFYMGGTPDPRLGGRHAELRSKVLTPDVLLQPHFASLEMVFYQGQQFPAQFKGDIFAAEHGSWNRRQRAGYEVLRVPLGDGHANGDYEDFLTGFTTPSGEVWGRPVGVEVAKDGSLLVSDDASGSVWRVTYTGK